MTCDVSFYGWKSKSDANLMNNHTVNIRQARQTAELTQTQAAHLMGVTRRTWQSWESGQHRMPSATWRLFLLLTTCECGQGMEL